MITEESLIADGWKRLPGVRYTAALGPTWSRMEDGQPVAGLLALEHLGNDSYGIVHGGALMTFADIALGLGVLRMTSGKHFVTLQMNVNFVAAAQVGEFITCAPEIVRETASVVFVRGVFEAGGRVVASADAIFKKVDPEKMKLKAG